MCFYCCCSSPWISQVLQVITHSQLTRTTAGWCPGAACLPEPSARPHGQAAGQGPQGAAAPPQRLRGRHTISKREMLVKHRGSSIQVAASQASACWHQRTRCGTVHAQQQESKTTRSTSTARPHVPLNRSACSTLSISPLSWAAACCSGCRLVAAARSCTMAPLKYLLHGPSSRQHQQLRSIHSIPSVVHATAVGSHMQTYLRTRFKSMPGGCARASKAPLKSNSRRSMRRATASEI